MDISVCGANCGECEYYATCKGCNVCKGVVFFCRGKECPIHVCCTEKGFLNCGQCEKMPCRVYLNIKDPKMSNEKFNASVEARTNNLKYKNQMKNKKED